MLPELDSPYTCMYKCFCATSLSIYVTKTNFSYITVSRVAPFPIMSLVSPWLSILSVLQTIQYMSVLMKMQLGRRKNVTF